MHDVCNEAYIFVWFLIPDCQALIRNLVCIILPSELMMNGSRLPPHVTSVNGTQHLNCCGVIRTVKLYTKIRINARRSGGIYTLYVHFRDI